ncbi:hypothetical protein SMD31_04375 [Dongia rigui]|uniref:Uncharacterized protein n=1 Tax=Dongia rigui TaxID=940149 RepID=A0ABU5DUX8_9PROT|nr:hypothetical protein [Dongia rigui]
MDPWRRKLSRLDRSRRSAASIANWGKVALGIGICAALWFLLGGRPQVLEKQNMAPEEAASATPGKGDASRLLEQERFAEALP